MSKNVFSKKSLEIVFIKYNLWFCAGFIKYSFIKLSVFKDIIY